MSTISAILPTPPDRFSTQIASASVSTSALSIDLDTTSGLGTEGVGVLLKKNASGEVTPGSIEFIHWTGVAGNTITLTDTGDRGLTGSDSGAQSYVADDYFEVWVNSYYDHSDALLVEHNANGTHDTDVVVTKTATQTLTNKTLTSPTINTPAIATPTITGSLTLDTAAQTSITDLNAGSLFKQSLINGNMDVWQRGTSIANTTANSYTADRWYVETATAGTDKTVSRQDGTGVAGSYYCARVAMVQDVDELLTFSQALESQDSIKFRGKKLTLSFYARGGAEFVADNATLVSKVVTGKGTDQKVLAFTNSADGVSQNNTLTTDWQKFTCTTTAVIAADITQIGVSFAFTHAGAGVTTNYFELTQVQLCAGDVALPFQPKSYEEELRACQRYCYATGTGSIYSILGYGPAISTTVARPVIYFPTTMRTIPSLTATAGEWQVSDWVNAPITITALEINTDMDIPDQVVVNATVASGLTQYRSYALVSGNNVTRLMIFSSEL